MNFKLSFLLIFLSLIYNICSFSENSLIENDSKYQNYEYLNIFKIPNSLILSSKKEKIKNSKFNKFASFLSMSSISSILKNQITFSFKDKTNFNRIAIHTSLDEQCKLTENGIKIYYKKISENNFILFENYSIKSIEDKIIIFLNEKLECKELKFELDELEECQNKLKEEDILFLSPETEYINENIINIYDKNDYRKLTLSKEYNTEEFITNLEKESKNYELSDYAKNYIKRIKAVYLGDATFDPRREFSTNPKSTSNVIYQRGDIEKYSKETLKMYWGTTNKQVTGIFGKANEVITIHVKKGNSKDPLPSIRFAQHIGHLQNYQGKIIPLKEGTQTVTVDNFIFSLEYTIPTYPGGPLYILNPYTSSQQSQNLTIYIEGGQLFPIYRLSQNRDEYENFLAEYVKLVQKDSKTYFDITELVGKNIMLTMRATDTYKKYTSGAPTNAFLSVAHWDIYIRKLLSYDGIKTDEDEPLYDIRNTYLIFNVRFMQYNGLAYSYFEHIGTHDKEWIDIALGFEEKIVGWGYPHEIGHIIDIEEREITETTNNMVAKYSETVLQGDGTWAPETYEQQLKYLAPDNIDNNLRGCEYTDKSQCKGFFMNYKRNYLIFWNIESMYHGYWGKVDNMYRYNDTLSTKLTKEEKFVYFSNIVLGLDLGYYFTRWGLTFSDGKSVFDELKTTSEYKNLMQKAINNKLIDNKTKKKYWYFDYKEYSNSKLECYKDKNEYNIQITKITKSSTNQYTLTLPSVKCPGHLGFEIYESNTIIGFTHGNTFTDTNPYESGYVPKYKIIAYDRLLESSNPSEYKSL